MLSHDVTRYMALDGPVQAEDPEPKHFVQLIAKKKALEVPSKILLAGAEHLRELQAEGRGQVQEKIIMLLQKIL